MAYYSSVYKDDQNFMKLTFVVSLGQEFEDYKAMVKYGSTDEIFGKGDGRGGIDPNISELLEDAGVDPNGPSPIYFTKRKARDTTLGGNDAINSYYQYCKNDDIRSSRILKGENRSNGMGRVYSENIDDNQQILYMTMGLPEYNSMTSFYKNVIIPDLANLMNNGSNASLTSRLSKLAGSVLGTFILLPVIPLIYIYNALRSLGSLSITKYYDFRPEMPLYYRMTNTIIIALAVNLGLAKDNILLDRRDSNVTGSTTSFSTYTALASDSDNEGQMIGLDDPGLPEVFRTSGWDIYRIMMRKYLYEEGVDLLNDPRLSTDDALLTQLKNKADADGTVDNNASDKSKTWTDDLFDGFRAGLYDANLFIGFKVEKSVDTSESISNQTGESPVATAVNAKMQNLKSLKHATMNGNLIDGPVGDLIGTIVSGLTSALSGVTDSLGLGGLSHLVKGSALIDIPEVWTNSSFQKSYSFNLSLRSPYGNPISIFQDIYVPLSLILAAALPRATGPNSYTSPFLIRAYCKGMLGIPLGMIDSVSIKRGSSQHGWSNGRLPTAIDVSFTIKDLSPAMYVGLGDDKLFDVVTGENSSFQEYLLTLSGMGLHERIRWVLKVRRKSQILLKSIYANRLSPFAISANVTSATVAGRMLQVVSPSVYLPNN